MEYPLNNRLTKAKSIKEFPIRKDNMLNVITIMSIILIALLSFYFFNQSNSCLQYNFIENASDGLKFQLNRCDILIVGKGIYSKTDENNDTIRIAICEECGIKNDCLGNNLRMLNQINTITDQEVIARYGTNEGAQIIENNKMIRKFKLSSTDLKSFYIYPLTYDKLEKIRLPNETLYDAYYRYVSDCQ